LVVRMNILHLANHCRLGHGNVHVAVDLACVQAKHGDAVHFASDDGEFRELLVSAGVEHHLVNQRRFAPWNVASAVAGLIRVIREKRIEVVHAHMMAGAVLGFLATRLTPAKLVTTVHNSFDAHSHLMRLGARAVAVSEADRRRLIGMRFSPRRVVTIINGSIGGMRAAWCAGDPDIAVVRPAIVYVGGLHARKGVDDIIEAFRRVAEEFPAATLQIVGDGPDREALEAQARATGLADRIVFHGGLSDPQRVLRNCDIFAMASRVEPFGLVNVEARVAGCAVVATDVGGVPEALDDGAAGILVPPNDAAAMASELRRLLADPSRLQEMKVRAGRGLERFHVDRMYGEYRALYESLLSHKRRVVGPPGLEPGTKRL
jgi:glycosyltransferase involved in cell wall biosynthesis